MFEALIKNARDRLQNFNTFRGTMSYTRDGVVDRDVDGDGKLDENPDNGSGIAAGVEVLKVPVFLGMDGPDGDGGTWTPEALDPRNFFELDENQVADLGLTTTREVFDYVVGEVVKLRESDMPSDLGRDVAATKKASKKKATKPAAGDSGE